MGARFPFASFPRGWFVVAFSSDVAAGEVKTVRHFDRDIVLFRGASGVIAALDKTCPHLGAHLGGGTVHGDCLRCPFHAWSFDSSGRCVDVPYAPKIPPRARVDTWHTREQNGAVFVWFDPQGGAPTWSPPVLEEDGWTANRTIRWEIASHPQEVAENTVDCSHLAPVHHVSSTKVQSVQQEGEWMRVVLELVASGYAIGMPDEINDVELDVTLHGLGVIVSQTHVITAGLRTRQRIHPTPIDADRIAIYALANTRHMPDPGYTREIDDIFWDAFVQDFARDFPIWENKAYLERPLLAGGDGPIGAYRKWARQFYAAPTTANAGLGRRSAGAPSLPVLTPVMARARELLDRSRHVLDGMRRTMWPGADVLRDEPGEATGSPASGATPGAPSATAPSRRFDSVDAYFSTLPARFDPRAAGELEAVFQWSLTGDPARQCYATVRRGVIETSEGEHEAPTVTIEMSSDDYLRMINGELNGAFAFSTGRGRLRGPVKLAMRMQKLFPLDRHV